MLEVPTAMTTLTPATTSAYYYNADNDVRRTNHGDITDYCANHSTLTPMQSTILEEPTTMTTLATAQRTMLEEPTTVISLTTAPTTAH